MNLARWLRFNLVGAMGMAVQFASLYVLAHLLPSHPLLTSAAAVEAAVLHNFFWHLRYTWPDRHSAWLPQLLRFQLANGFVSLTGNVLLMHLLVGRIPLLAANALAIVVCSLLNFTLSHVWAFSPPPNRPASA